MIGFSKITESLREAAAAGRLNHSHILLGPDGIGKSPLAEKLAVLILDPKGATHRTGFVDILHIRLSGNSIGVDEIRKLIGEANIKPFEGDRKVIVIHKGDALTVQAQNALLKTLEDPPQGVYFIILSENLDMLLPTIRSRCAVHRLSPLSRGEMASYIQQAHGSAEPQFSHALAIARGIPGEADLYIKDEEYRGFLDFILQFALDLSLVKSLRDKNCLKILDKNKLILSYGPVRFLEALLLLMRDVSVVKICKDYKNIIFLYNNERVKAIAGNFSMARLSSITEECDRGLKLLITGRNINKETVIDSVLMRLTEES